MDAIEIRECTELGEMSACVDLQRDVFALPEVELSPVRHMIVTKNAGGFVLGAFSGADLIGFVLSVPAFVRGERAFYSHMTAVRKEFQGSGVGARLKWAQRQRSLEEGVKLVKWTFEPGKARNAFFNLEKLGAVVTEYRRNFYGTDYPNLNAGVDGTGIDSDRLFAEWHLESKKVATLASGGIYAEESESAATTIRVPTDWNSLVAKDPTAAIAELDRIRVDFEKAFSNGLICRGFRREESSYLLYPT